MSFLNAFTRRGLCRGLAASVLVGGLTACGGGDVGIGVGVVIPVRPPVVVVAPLTLVLTRVGPAAIQVDWNDDPHVARFLVVRDGFTLASVSTTTSLVDGSVLPNETYCYQVQGYDAVGDLVAESSTGCITVFP